MRFTGRCFRGHDPSWSFSPLSGAGAALTGGRFNRKGTPTLYLALDIVTAVGECTQGMTERLHPLVICEYDIDCEDIADLRDEASRDGHGVSLDDLASPWLNLQLAGNDSPSCRVADGLRSSGFAGALVPSFFPGADATNQNLVLWGWGAGPPHQVQVFDLQGRLPRDRRSWPKTK